MRIGPEAVRHVQLFSVLVHLSDEIIDRLIHGCLYLIELFPLGCVVDELPHQTIRIAMIVQVEQRSQTLSNHESCIIPARQHQPIKQII